MSEPPALYPKLDPTTYSLPPTPPVGIQHSRIQNQPLYVQPPVNVRMHPVQYQQQAYYKQPTQNFPSSQNYGYAPSVPYPPNTYYQQSPSYPIPQNYPSQPYISNSPTKSNYPPQLSANHTSNINSHQNNIPSQQYQNQYSPQSQQFVSSTNLYNYPPTPSFQNGTPNFPNYYPSNPPPNHYVPPQQPQPQQPHPQPPNHAYQQHQPPPQNNYQTPQHHNTNQAHSTNTASNFSLFSNPNFIQSSSTSQGKTSQKIETYSSNAFSNPSIFPELHDNAKHEQENSKEHEEHETEDNQEVEENEEEIVETSDNLQQRKLIRAVQRCERTLNRLISAMNRRNKTAAISAHEKLQTQVEEIKHMAQHGTLHEVNTFLHQVKKATDYFENEFQVVIQQINEEREQNLAQYRKTIKELQQDVSSATKLLDESLKGTEKSAQHVMHELKKEAQ